MALFKKSNLMDVIRCDEPSYLIWKWRPAEADANAKRANAIRWGSSLRVREGSVAVLAYSQPNGCIYDYIEGPADTILETYNLPVLADLIGKAYGGGSPFQAEIYFINLAELIQSPFGVPFFDVFDPRFQDFAVPTAVRGTINFKITDYREFIRLHRLENFDMKDFQAQVRSAVVKTVKAVVSNAPASYDIPVMQLERKLQEINELVEDKLRQRLYRDFGVTVSGIDISAIEIDKASDGYRQLKTVAQDVSAAAIQAQTEVNIQNMRDMQRIQAEHIGETLRAQREESQYARRVQTQTEHMAAHQLNQQAAVGIAGAEALGQMSAGGGMNAGIGLNPAALAAGMAMGGAIGQNVAGMVTGVMSGMTPPPVPAAASEYYVVQNGTAKGPYSLQSLRQMAASRELTGDTLVWTAGMQAWSKAAEVAALRGLFESNPPVPPPIP